MVFDWFRRQAAPEPATPEQASAAPAAPETAEARPEPAAPEQPAAPEHPAEPPEPASASPPSQDALEWARQAYARLKAQQEAARLQDTQPAPEPAAAPEPPPAPESQAAPESPPARPEPEPSQEPERPPAAGPSLLEQAAARRAERQQALTAPAAPAPSEPASPAGPAAAVADSPEPRLGAFDDTFTWSAEVLAAQGRSLDQVSLEEIDWLGRLRQGLEKTRRGFVTQLLDTLGDDPLSPELLDDLETALLRADVGVSATDRVLEALRQRLNEEVVDSAEGLRFLKEQLRAILDGPIEASAASLLAPQKGRLNVWLMVGVNGVGKTTTLGKLANLAVRSGYSCVIAAADTFRAAAVQQVQAWGDRSQVPVIANPSANADPAAVVYDAIGAAQAKGTELVLVDTAGRLQTKHNLMEELSKVRRIIDRLAPEAVVESLLVLDASQGQNGLRQAMAFASAAGLTGVVITKLDGSARGGVALAVASEAGLPIRFIGAGEGIRDLRPFNSFEFVEALLAG
ncbi:MAG: signal recognition particle-docking protein FtsY [Cyanobium sp. PLM2.Bin73]|nr:MAG: signal recognition particle-docking protein FtsY [Cyanobium sp. PLM2.Bin73]